MDFELFALMRERILDLAKNWIRSSGQQARRDREKKIAADLRSLVDLLARHEAALKNMLREISTVLDNAEGGPEAREYLRLRRPGQ